METSDFRRRIEETVKAVRLYVEHDMRHSDNVQQALQERNAEEWEYNDCGPDWTRMRARTTAEFADELAACQTIGDLLLFRGRMERVKIHASAQELCPVVGAAHYMLQMSYWSRERGQNTRTDQMNPPKSPTSASP